MSKQLSCVHQIKMKFRSRLEKKIHLHDQRFISWASRFALLNLVLGTRHGSGYASCLKTQDFGPKSPRKTRDHSKSAKAFYRFTQGKKGRPLVPSTLLAHFCPQSNQDCNRQENGRQVQDSTRCFPSLPSSDLSSKTQADILESRLNWVSAHRDAGGREKALGRKHWRRLWLWCPVSVLPLKQRPSETSGKQGGG